MSRGGWLTRDPGQDLKGPAPAYSTHAHSTKDYASHYTAQSKGAAKGEGPEEHASKSASSAIVGSIWREEGAVLHPRDLNGFVTSPAGSSRRLPLRLYI